ncbi:cell adhesion molecule CEACAM6-like [Mobula birostris]|uniref:cell adhesion molecule CEACAM6-like n=1 Tax=Mobula birostris TaxID=1983395 RepID=UPI003B28825B
MSGLPFAALVLCLCITAGESQQFTIFVERSQLSVTVGGNALFSVRPSGNVISGNWSFNGETIAQWINQTVTVDKAYTSRAYVFISNGSLLLKSLNMSDNGEYRVTIVPTNGSRTSATIFLRVIEPVSNVTVTSNATRLIEYSDSVAITCFARGTEVSYLWLKENSPIIPCGRFELSADNSTLAVSGVRRTDENFTCRASNLINSSTSAPFHLDVYYGPDRPYIITQPNSSLHVAGSTIRLTCLTQSRPVAELKWRLNGAHPQSGQVLILDNISVCQTGNYTCEAYNNVTNRKNTSTTQINVLAKTDGIFTLGSGAIAGIMLGLLGVGLIGGITGWLTARKTGGIKDPPQSKHDTSTNSGKNSTLDTNAADASQNYENFPGNEQGTMDNADDGNSTYMGLVLQDRSAYSDLKR